MMFNNFYPGRKVLITGHTGFKGSWLALWLASLGAEVTGYALAPPSDPNLFNILHLDDAITHVTGDIRDEEKMADVFRISRPDIVFHLAAQSLVKRSYLEPKLTYETNVIGTVNLLEAVKKSGRRMAVINVTSDKCYENREWVWGYREYEPLGGYDPYSSSKACSELVTAAYRTSFFHPDTYAAHGVGIASARAGNVIGGGDWAQDRLVPDCIRALLAGEKVTVRNPAAVRPWQHVLEPLSGYLLLAQKLFQNGSRYAEAWNFGPHDRDAKPTEWLVERLCRLWGKAGSYEITDVEQAHEAHCLKLDSSKAEKELGWQPRWSLEETIDSIVAWTRAYEQGQAMRDLCLKQIDAFTSRG